MAEKVEEENRTDSGGISEEDLREELYEQFDVSSKGKLAIRYILPILDRVVDPESRYDVDPRSKILAEISLYHAYENEPKFKIFVWASVLLGTYDLLHPLDPAFYGILFATLATLNGFVYSLRSPKMMAAELEGVTDDDGMPADYRVTALSSVNSNITLVLFVIAVGVQLLVTSSVIRGEILSQNVANGVFYPAISALVLVITPIIYNWARSSSKET